MLHRFTTSITDIPLPERFTYPFCYTPHPLCILAAKEVQSYLTRQTAWKDELRQGKMFGVLIVQTEHGETGYLAAFSGILAGKNLHPFFVPPVYDLLQPQGFFKIEEENISSINRNIRQLENDKAYAALSAELARTIQSAENILATAKAQLKEAKTAREQRRKEKELNAQEEAELIRESQFQKAEYKRLERSWKARITTLQTQTEDWERRISALKSERKTRSAALQQKLFEQFGMLNYRGEVKNLCEIFGQTVHKTPPAGAGECAAPKLLQYAFEHRLTPLAIAEFWWGASPKGEIRRHGHYYPACRGKCGPILAHMLRGLDVEPEPDRACPQSAPELLYEDRWIAAVFKPAGMLSVPGKSEAPSILDWARERYPAATGPLVVHRLDMDTSGVLLLALTKEAHQDLQAQFKPDRPKTLHRPAGGADNPAERTYRTTPATGPPRPSPTGGRSPARKAGDHGVRSVGIPERPHPHRLLPADRPHAPVARPCGPSIGTQCSDRGRPTVRNSRPAVASACRTDRIPPSGDRRSDSD